VLSTIALVAVIATATIITPYNPVIRGVSDALHAVAPNTFLGSEPQNVAVLGIADGVADNPSGVLLVRVAEDGLGLTAIPPDTASEIPGHGRGHIGEVIGIGGPDLMRQTVGRVTDTDVQFYYLIKPDGIREIVHSANGIVIDVPRATSGRTYPGGPLLTLRPGQQTLDGDQAIVYLQGNDLQTDAERAKRQQRFLYSMFRQTLAPSNLLTNPAALVTWSDNVETNMSSVQVAQLASRIRKLKESDAAPKTDMIVIREEAPSAQ
jgi:anionic cell wall polymer biosynthesis LytR-Cps2A-Psr (LCP) family protein